MKMVKSLLLGSAAGLVAVAGAQAADLPVKAKPVEYVKVCSIYGAGFWYIPGTDTCIKLGGWVRAEWAFFSGNSDVPQNQGGAGRNNRIDSQDLGVRARWVISTDIRTQTEYGTLRAYARAGYQTTTGETTQGRIYTERAFIQFAGFTLGKTQSYFDFYSGAFCYGCGFMGAGSQTGAAGTLLAAYTATFGNGFTATLSVEDGFMRRGGIWDTSDAANPLTLGAIPGPATTGPDAYNIVAVNVGDYAANSVPDIVGALRVDQAWGSAQIAGALHQLRAGYYGNNVTSAGSTVGFGIAPADAWGFAVMAGVVFNLPWSKGDQFWVEGAYSQGGASYVGWSATVGTTNSYGRFNGQNVAAAWALDGVFGCATAGMTASTGLAGCTNQQLTTFWTLEAGIQHYWTPALRTSLYGSYNAAQFNATATTLICQSPNSPIRTLAGGTLATNAGCNPNFNTWNAGTRTIWNPVANLDIGLEIMYSRVETNYNPTVVALNFAGAGGRAAGLYAPSSENIWSGILRFQRNFWP